MGDCFTHSRKMAAIRAAEDSGEVADSQSVRLSLIAEVHAGTKTLEQVQAELRKIRKGAKRLGLKTRSSVYRHG